MPELAASRYTVEEALEHIGLGRTQIIMFLFVGIAWAGDGMEMMLLSYLGPELKCKWNLSAAQESWITSVVFIGMMLGSYSWGAISDRYGRKIGYFAPAVFTAAFGILSATAPNYGALLFFRGCVGFGIAGAHVAYTLFMEYITPAHRGQFLSLIEGFWTVGSIFLAGMAWVVLPTRGWRALVLVAAAPLIILVAVYPFLKESPHWLLANDRVLEAQGVLEWVASMNGKDMPPGHLVHHAERNAIKHAMELAVRVPAEESEPAAEPAVIQTASAPEAPKGVRQHLSEFFKGIGTSFRRMVLTQEMLVTSVLLAVVWVAVALSYYGSILFGVELQTGRGDACVDGEVQISGDDFKEVFITSLGEIGGLVLAMLLVDNIGRRRCLWLFMIGASICTTPLLRGDAPDQGEANGQLDIAALFCTRMFAYGTFIVLYIYTPELYPTQIRSFAFGLYNALSRLGGLVSPFIAVDVFEKAGAQAAAGVFLGASIVAALVSMFLPIETKGIDLPEDVDDMQASQEKHKYGTKDARKRAYEARMRPGAAQDGQGGGTSNPFATAQDLASGRAEQYQDQYGLDGVEQ